MNINRVISISAFACLVSLVLAQGNTTRTTLSGTAGSVAGKDSSGAWVGLAGSASTASISYVSNDGGQGPPESGSHEDKFGHDVNGNPVGKTLNGAFNEGSNGDLSVTGQSSVNSSGSTTYYTVGLTSTTNSYAGATGPTDSGTYDPWDIHYADVLGLGSPGGLVDLYYQAGLSGAGFSGPGFGQYGFSLYLTTATSRISLLDITVGSDGTRRFTLGNDPMFELHVLGANADDPLATPDDRLATSHILSSTELGSFFNPDGSMTQDLNIGVLYKGFVIPRTGDPNDVLFSWHTDYLAASAPASAVPGPAGFVAFAVGGLATLRRRRRR